MAQTVGVVCGEDGEPLHVEYRGLPPNNEVLRGVLAVRPGGMIVFEQLTEQPVIAEPDDSSDFRVRSDDEIMRNRQRVDAGLTSAQLGTIGARELDAVGARRTVAADPLQHEPMLVGPPEPASAPPVPQQPVQEQEQPPQPPPGPPQPPQPPAVQELVTTRGAEANEDVL